MRNSSNSINKLKNSNSNFNLKKSLNNFISSQIKGNNNGNANAIQSEKTNINTPKYIETIRSERDKDRERDKERQKSPSFKNPAKLEILSIYL
jgi:hypothetical protein